MTTFKPPSVSTLAAVPPPAPEPMMQTSYTLGERITWDIQNLRENRGLRRNRPLANIDQSNTNYLTWDELPSATLFLRNFTPSKAIDSGVRSMSLQIAAAALSSLRAKPNPSMVSHPS